ncbi:LysM peptidoglycan-binding domain-containing protein [Bacillus sp. BGMRC 2118]|nr:LysM peptidoglycan-binding domain-containing protein [Bacillus sp. BGMRC 2118]
MPDSRNSDDQAQQLREKMKTSMNPETTDLDVLELPPRSKIHKAKEGKTKKVKFKFPLVRFLAFIFVLLPIAILVYTFYISSEGKEVKEIPKVKEQPSYKENISLQHKNNETTLQQGIKGDSKVAKEEEYKTKFHTVQPDDTLYTISQHYYSSREGEALIKEWNDLETNELTDGQVLKIPIKYPD